MKKIVIILIGILFLGLAGYIVWNESNQSEVMEKFSVENIEQIVINTQEWDIQLVQSDQNIVKVVTKEPDKKRGLTVKVQSNIIQIYQKNSEGGLFGGFSFRNNKTIKIMVPVSYSNRLKIVTKSGDVSICNIALNNLYVKSVNGDINLQRIDSNASKMTEITTEYGDIDLLFKTEPTNLKLNISAMEVDNLLGTNKFGNGSKQLDLACPNGTLSLIK